jgi:hypothetical protein
VKSFSIQNQNPTSVRFQWSESPLIKFNPKIGHLHPGASKSIQISLQSQNTPPANPLIHEEVKCLISKISYQEDQLEWDDRVKTVQWVDSSHAGRNLKEKIYETEPEPPFTVVDELPSLSIIVQASVVNIQN